MDITLEDFAGQAELWGIISDLVCGECKTRCLGCLNCPARDMMEEIEDLIGREGVTFMENLVKEWAK